MQRFFFLVYAGLAAMTAVAVLIRTPADPDAFTWCTDTNPARTEQIGLFVAEAPEYSVALDPGDGGMEKLMVQCLAGHGPDFFDIPTFTLSALSEAGVALDVSPVVDMGRHPAPSPAAFADSPYYQHLRQRFANALDALDGLEGDFPENPGVEALGPEGDGVGLWPRFDELDRNPYVSSRRRQLVLDWRTGDEARELAYYLLLENAPERQLPRDGFGLFEDLSEARAAFADARARARREAFDLRLASAADRQTAAETQAVAHAVAVGRALDRDRLFPLANDAVWMNGGQYAFPCNIWGNLVAVHVGRFEEAGRPLPRRGWQWEEFTDSAVAMTTVDPATGRRERFGLYNFFDPLEVAVSHGGRVWNETGTRSAIHNEPMRAAHQYQFELREAAHAMPLSTEMANLANVGGWGAGMINDFASGRFAMMVYGRYGRINWRRMNDERLQSGREPLRVEFAPMPESPETVYFGGSRLLAINGRSPRKWEALDFMAFLGGAVYGRQINWSADCVPGPREYLRETSQLSNPRYPDEHATDPIWREWAETVRQPPLSPYLPATRLGSIRAYYQGFFDIGLVTAEEMLRLIASDVNREMDRFVSERPELHEAHARDLERQRELDRGREEGGAAREDGR